jgi:hypothetical protein
MEKSVGFSISNFKVPQNSKNCLQNEYFNCDILFVIGRHAETGRFLWKWKNRYIFGSSSDVPEIFLQTSLKQSSNVLDCNVLD